jgi:hypothetical protein
MSDLSRVVFYSVDDMSSHHNLKNAELLLAGIDINKSFDINELLELRNIQLYFENQMFLTEWDDATRTNFKAILQHFDPKIKDYFVSLNDQVFADQLSAIEFNYRKAYWALFNNLHSYEKISSQIFEEVLTKNPYHINYILSHRKIVEHFNVTIRDFLFAYQDAAEIILTGLEEAERIQKVESYLPKALTLSDRQDIISRYIAGPDPNLNFISFIENAKDSSQLRLSDKVRLQAQKKSKEINESILSDKGAGKFGIAVTFDKNQKEEKKVTNEGLDTELSYSREFLDSLQDDVKLFTCFFHLFEYLDAQRLITLVGKESEKNVMERVGMASKNAYPGGFSFQYKGKIALIQINIFDAYLKHRGISVEKLIQSFIHERLQKFPGLQTLRFTLPEENASHLSKIRLLAPELEFLLKQYQCFINDGIIDFELLQIGSSQLSFSDVGSLVEGKYVYPKKDELARLKYLFFSDQSHLFYVKPFEKKYHSFYDLITHEKVKLDSYESYQRGPIDGLITDGYLIVDNDGCIEIAKPIHIFLIGMLHKNGVLNYWRCDKQLRDSIDEMIEWGWVETSSSLLTKDEVSYFNYFLNQKEFTDGFNIRNKYLHGTNEHNAGQQQFDYYYLLILIILALLKIDDDLLCGILEKRNKAEG